MANHIIQRVEGRWVVETFLTVPLTGLYARLNDADAAIADEVADRVAAQAIETAAREDADAALIDGISAVDARVDGEQTAREAQGEALADVDAALADRIEAAEDLHTSDVADLQATDVAISASLADLAEAFNARFPVNTFTSAVDRWELGLIYGQSNSIGFNSGTTAGAMFSATEGSSEYGGQFAGHVLMFNGGMRTIGQATTNPALVLPKANLASLVPAHEAFDDPHDSGDTMGTRLGARLAESLADDTGLILSAVGVGSQPVESLSKGTVPFENLLKVVRRAKYLADLDGSECVVPWIAYEQGETGSTGWKAKVVQLRADLDAAIKAITGQTEDVIFYLTQIAVQWDTIPEIVLDAYALSVEVATRDHFILVGPKYWGTFTDAVHEDNLTQNRKGYLFGEAIDNGPTWKPCHMVSAVVAGGNVKVTFDRDITIDTSAVAAIANYGFTAWLAGVPLLGATTGAVSGATKTGAREITLSFVGGAPFDTGDLGQIGCAAHSDSVATTGANLGPRSNVRGTGSMSKTIGGVSRTIYTGWACHQLITF